MDFLRRTGRTWRKMQRLPDGAIFVVTDKGEQASCRRMLVKMGRGPHALDLVVLADAHDAVRALSPGTEWDIDHYASDVMTAGLAALLMPYRKLRVC